MPEQPPEILTQVGSFVNEGAGPWVLLGIVVLVAVFVFARYIKSGPVAPSAGMEPRVRRKWTVNGLGALAVAAAVEYFAFRLYADPAHLMHDRALMFALVGIGIALLGFGQMIYGIYGKRSE